uniref:ER membrane protein complex subunit 1 n=1 Tax=Ciona savignyi TaxID=51511 RepID=H2ZLW0_CIOSA
EKIYVNMFLKRSTPIGFRLLVKSDDSSVMLVAHPNRVMWRRHESLAEIVDAAMIDLPLSDADAGIEAEFDESSTTKRPMLAGMFAKRIKAQSQQLLSWFRQVMKEVEEGTLFKHKTRDPLIQVEGLTRDPFSLHKMIVVVTKSGTLFGIDSLSGDIVWRHYIPNLEKSARWNFYFYVQRTTAHFPHPPQMALLALDSDHSQQPVLLTFNPITGEVNKQKSLLRPDVHIIQVMLLPSTDASHLRPLILLNSDMTLQLFPDSTDVRSLINTLNLFMYDVDTTSGTPPGVFPKPRLNSTALWVVKVPPSHKISTVAGKKMLEKVDSLGRPLADRSVIFKYLNPNAIAVVSESLDDNVDRSSLFLLIVDAVTGQTIHSSYHKKATGPVKMIHSENWLLYSYWNAKARRTEITSMEFYEGKTQHNSTAFSSFEAHPPLLCQQSYIFPTGISCIGVSQTDKAITSRQILFGLKRGALLGLPRRFFDPRRPLTMEDSHREEGLVQYMPEIPIPPELFLSYNLSIESIDGVYSAPAALESTSLVLTTGIDIFFTRTQPSKMFDVLKEDFDHFFISTVLIGMFVAALVVRRMSQIKQLKKAWK